MLSRRAVFPRRGPVSERVFGKAYAEAEHGGSGLAAGLFAIALFIFVASLSFYEVTRSDRALVILAAGIASLTDIDRVLDENLAGLREEARGSSDPLLQLEDFPLPVTISRLDVLTAEPEAIRASILRQSAQLVYDTGLDVFDETGEQAVELLSITNVIRELIRFLTGDVHEQAGWAALGALIAATLLGAATLALNRGFARFTNFGLAALLASAPGYVLAWGASWLLDRYGAEDAFVVDLQTVVQAMLAVPERNFLITGGLGLVIAVGGAILGLIANRFFSDASGDPIDYDEGPVVPFVAVPGPAVETRARRLRLPVPALPRPARPDPPPTPPPDAGGDG